jgi:hypothetical protein
MCLQWRLVGRQIREGQCEQLYKNIDYRYCNKVKFENILALDIIITTMDIQFYMFTTSSENSKIAV